MKCEQCGKEHDGTFGSGRFCCRSCSNKYVALHQSPEAKARKVAKGAKNLRNDIQRGKPHTEETKRKISESVRVVMKNPEIISKISVANRGKIVSVDTRRKLSIAMHKAIEEGRHSGWAHRRNSYPERYWSDVLDSLGISYLREYPVPKLSIGGETGGCYFLDFLLPGNVDLEVDGSQHDFAVEYDSHRDALLRNAGYLVYRVKWFNPSYNREALLKSIADFKSWYSIVCPINSTVE